MVSSPHSSQLGVYAVFPSDTASSAPSFGLERCDGAARGFRRASFTPPRLLMEQSRGWRRLAMASVRWDAMGHDSDWPFSGQAGVGGDVIGDVHRSARCHDGSRRWEGRGPLAHGGIALLAWTCLPTPPWPGCILAVVNLAAIAPQLRGREHRRNRLRQGFGLLF
jgi:hypothetical protein